MLWWNVNKNLPSILNVKCSLIYEDSIDLIFVSETCLSIDALPQLDGYKVVSDPTIKICSHGGMAWYVKPEISLYFDETMFGKLCAHMS